MTDPAYAAFVARLTAPQPVRQLPPQPVVDWQAVAQREARRRQLRKGRKSR